jgi:hypothetical protein
MKTRAPFTPEYRNQSAASPELMKWPKLYPRRLGVVPSDSVVTVIESDEIRLKVLVAVPEIPVAVIVTTVVPRLLGKVPLIIPVMLSSLMLEGRPVCEKLVGELFAVI